MGGSIKFINVISDSRFPIGAECVWAGEAELQFVATKVKDSIRFNLFSSGKHFGQDTLLFNLHLNCLKLPLIRKYQKVLPLKIIRQK